PEGSVGITSSGRICGPFFFLSISVFAGFIPFNFESGRRCPFGDSFCASFLLGVLGAEESTGRGARGAASRGARAESCLAGGRRTYKPRLPFGKSCARGSELPLSLEAESARGGGPGEKGTKRSLTKWLNRGVSGKGKAKAQTTTDTGRFIENVDGPSTKQ
ncbi:hypothetical protein B0H14DRAFT_2879482, partial [Mycena olivaceomarginata]